MIKSYLAKASPISALILALHLLAATGFASTVPARHRHRRASAAHPEAQRPVRAPLKRVVAVASRTPTRLTVVQAPKAALAGARAGRGPARLMPIQIGRASCRERG